MEWKWDLLRLEFSPLVLTLFLLTFHGLAWQPTTLAAQYLSEQHEAAILAAARQNENSVVQIELIGGNPSFGQENSGAGPFSGTVIGRDGLIVTSGNFFAAPFAGIVVSTGDQGRLPARLVARDHSRNLALLKIEAPPAAWTEAKFIDGESLQVGQTVIALGRSLDSHTCSISFGILSATNRIGGKALQLDAKINLRNYGGLLVALDGRPIGVLAPLAPDSSSPDAGLDWYDSGIGFAIPIDAVHRSVGRLRHGEDQHIGQLGIMFDPTASPFDPPEIRSVHPGSPAALAGFRGGDLIVKLNGRTPNRISQVQDWVAPLYSGDAVEMVVSRKGDLVTALPELTSELPPYSQPLLGLIPDENSNPTSAKILMTWEGGPGAKAGLRGGDVIWQIDGEPTRNWERVREILNAKLPGDIITIDLRDSSNNNRSVQIELGKMNAEIWLEPSIKLANSFVAKSIKNAEFKNKATLFTSESSNLAKTLLVWLPEAGAPANDEWQAKLANSIPDTLALLVIESTDSQKWQTDDEEVVMEFLSLARRQLGADINQVAIGGHRSGASMAVLIGSRNRQFFQGLALRECGNSEPMDRLVVKPGLPLMIWLNRESSKEVVDSLPDLETSPPNNGQLPIFIDLKSYQSDVDFIQAIGSWALQLNRL